MSSDEAVASRGLGRWATALVALGGVVVAWYLTEFHIQAVVGETVGGALCESEGIVDCASAVMSDYSLLLGIPISLLGVAFYGAVLGLVIFDRQAIRDGDDPFRPGAIAATTFGLGLIYSLFLAGVSAFVLATLCPFCAMLYAVNLVGFVAACVWAGERPHRLVWAQVRRPAAVISGWSGLFAIGFAVLLAFGVSVTNSEIDNRQRSAPAVEVAEVERVAEERYRLEDAPGKGPRDGPVHIVEFSNFTCPFCARLAGVLHQLAQAYPEEVRVEFRHFPLPGQEQGHLAARASHCADEQGLFWPMHDQLFAGDDLERAAIEEKARQVGLEAAEFARCVDSEGAHRRIDDDMLAGQRLGIRGTPTFYLNGLEVAGARSYAELVEMVERELQEVAPTGRGSQ